MVMPFVLAAAGILVCLATIVAARRTRHRRDAPSVAAETDGWPAYAPAGDDAERARQARLWPIAAFLTGLVLVAGGLVVSQASRTTVPSVIEPYFIELGSSSELPAEEPSEEPATGEEELGAEPTPTPGRTSSPTASPRVTPQPTAVSRPATPRPTPPPPTATPTPTPLPKPGPNVGASTSCFRGRMTGAAINYNVSSRPNTVLNTVTLYLDGAVVQRPPVRGRGSYTGTYTQEVQPGPHTYRVVALGSDGGTTDRAFAVCR